ncbi:Hypothetical predicted protein [Mytilus galloprovincialis]|uniref:Uncharacterized protein n=1 Tax=Mytilus galloprovincialis TaxID=29158 RepID=A0A8B6CJE8_MYTGA|nr:Hypothetical predicted protein [Mytilus galloprovincialis]
MSPGCVTKLLDQLQWESLQHRRWKQSLVLCYKTQHQMIAIDPAKYYASGDSRTRGNHKFRQTRVKREVYMYYHSFFPRTTREWNKLPESVVESGSLEDFGARVNTIPWTNHILNRQQENQCIYTCSCNLAYFIVNIQIFLDFYFWPERSGLLSV